MRKDSAPRGVRAPQTGQLPTPMAYAGALDTVPARVRVQARLGDVRDCRGPAPNGRG